MRDALYEESAQSLKSKSEARMYMVFHVLSIICVVLAVVWFFITIMIVPSVIDSYNEGRTDGIGIAVWVFEFVGPLLILLLLAFLFFRFKRRFNISFDYLFVEDELRITKVFNGRKRKFITTIKADQILKIGNCEDEDGFENTMRGLGGKKPKFMTPNREPAEDKYFIYILRSSSIEKNVYVIECRINMLEYLVRAAGRNKLEWKK